MVVSGFASGGGQTMVINDDGVIINPAHMVRAAKHWWNIEKDAHWKSLPPGMRAMIKGRAEGTLRFVTESYDLCWYVVRLVDGSEERVPSFGVMDRGEEARFLSGLVDRESVTIIEGTHPRWILAEFLPGYDSARDAPLATVAHADAPSAS